VGLFPDYSVAAKLIPADEAEQPDAGNRSRYDALYPLFQQAYLALEPVFARLATIETG
jgi:sugar (pentulose or hexulose) kinase